MSATSILYYLDLIPKPINKLTFYMMKNDEGVLSNINAYQARQAFLPILLYTLTLKVSTTVAEVYEYIKQHTDQDIPVILAFKVYNSTGKFIGSHAVVAFDTYDYSDNVKYVIVYDNNYPGMARVVRFDLSRNEIYYICGYNKTTGDIYYAKNPIAEQAIAYESDVVEKLVEAIKEFLEALIDYLKNNNLNLIIFNCPVNVTIVDQYGRVLSDGGINEIPNARVEIVGETKMFYIPSNLTYTVNVDAYDYGNFSLALFTANEKITTFSNISVNPNTEAVVRISPSSIPTMDIDYDGDGNTDKQLISPVSNYSYSISGLTVTFDASLSYDPDGDIVSYYWDFGDGSNETTTTPIATHTYSTPGTYTVTLTVMDDEGLTNSTSKEITLGIGIIYIEPEECVAPNEEFEVGIWVEDGEVGSVLVNFSFDNTKATFVDGETYGIFDFDTLTSGEDYVRYLGVSTSPVDTSTKTKVASVTFKAVGEVGDDICFDVITATIDGKDAEVVSECVQIVSEPWQSYDQNHNGKIEDNELINAILDWLNNLISDEQLINVILKWLS